MVLSLVTEKEKGFNSMIDYKLEIKNKNAHYIQNYHKALQNLPKIPVICVLN